MKDMVKILVMKHSRKDFDVIIDVFKTSLLQSLVAILDKRKVNTKIKFIEEDNDVVLELYANKEEIKKYVKNIINEEVLKKFNTDIIN